MRGKQFERGNGELFTPLWISAARLLFAAMLLYVIRNPAPMQQLEASLQTTTDLPAALILNIPVSNVAVAATEQKTLDNKPM